MIVAEMELRGFCHRSPMKKTPVTGCWPKRFIDEPAQQFVVLSEKYEDDKRGRIPLPRDVQQLWAQHKYSVLARDPARYRAIGRWVSGHRGTAERDFLAWELVQMMRRTPPRNRLCNALEHLWGYVKDFAGEGEIAPGSDPNRLVRRIQELVLQHHVRYLLESTALTDLAVWVCVAA